MEEQITTTQLVSDIGLKAYESIDFEDLGSKENRDKIDIVMKTVDFIADEDKKELNREESEKDRELEYEKAASNERIRMAEIENNKKDRIIRYIETGVKGAGIIVELLRIFVEAADHKQQRASDTNLAMINMEYKKQSDIETRNFIDEQNLKSYIFEETGTARSTANKRTEKLLDSYSRVLNEHKK